MTFYGDYISGGTSTVSVATVLTYNATTNVIASTDARVVVESGSDFWGIKLEGNYAMRFEGSALTVESLTGTPVTTTPRLDFYCYTCGIRTRIASLTKTGTLYVPAVSESDTVPDTEMNLFGDVELARLGMTTPGIVEGFTQYLVAGSDGNAYLLAADYIDGQPVLASPVLTTGTASDLIVPVPDTDVNYILQVKLVNGVPTWDLVSTADEASSITLPANGINWSPVVVLVNGVATLDLVQA